MLSGDVADRAIELLQDLSNVSTGNAMDLIQDLLTLLPPDIQEVIASSDDPIALLGELKEFLIGQGQLPESGTTEDVGNILESSSVNGDAAVEDVFSVARPRTSPPNVSRVSRPPTGPSNSLFESRDIPSTPGFLMRRTSTHLSSPWQASSQASPPLLPGSPFKLNNSKLSFHAYPKKASSFSLGRTMDKENPEGTLPDWLVTDQPGKSGPTFEHGDASVSSSSGIPPVGHDLFDNSCLQN